jgi:hypothetical protein
MPLVKSSLNRPPRPFVPFAYTKFAGVITGVVYGLLHRRGVGSRCFHNQEESMLAAIGAILLIMWLLGFFAFHVTVGFIHILLVIGIIMIIAHFMRGSTAS